MASLFSMNKTQLISMKREQERAIDAHKKQTYYSTSQRQHEIVLKRLQRRLSDIEEALARF